VPLLPPRGDRTLWAPVIAPFALLTRVYRHPACIEANRLAQGSAGLWRPHLGQDVLSAGMTMAFGQFYLVWRGPARCLLVLQPLLG